VESSTAKVAIPTDQEVSKLRDEVIGFQKAKAELLRWKLVAIGTASAAGLGLSEFKGLGERPIILLSLVPLLAAYCDVVSRDYDIRIALIGRFLRVAGGPFSRYELSLAGQSWRFNKAATRGSSIGACLFVLAVALSRLPECDWATLSALILSGLLGIVLVWWVEREYGCRMRVLGPPGVSTHGQ